MKIKVSEVIIGKKYKVFPAPASCLFRMYGEEVLIIGKCHLPDVGTVYTFKHKEMGLGALFLHGFYEVNSYD